MKKLLFAFILLLPSFGFSQTVKPITGVLGVNFGDDSTTVKSVIQKLGGRRIYQTSRDTALTFEGLSLNGKKLFYFSVSFTSNHADYIMLAFYPSQSATGTITNYNQVVKEFNNKYGKGISKGFFLPPYKNGDGKEAEALHNAKGLLKTCWYGDNNTTVEMRTLGATNIVITYNNKIIDREDMLD